MYIIMYKYSALKINRKSFPNNIKNPIAPAQRISTEYMRTGYPLNDIKSKNPHLNETMGTDVVSDKFKNLSENNHTK